MRIPIQQESVDTPATKPRTSPAKARQRQKHVPQRTCIACRRTDTKRELMRLVRIADGRVALDPTGKRHGRGAYVCLAPACWELALKRRSVERALRIETLHPEDRETLMHFARNLELESADNAEVT